MKRFVTVLFAALMLAAGLTTAAHADPPSPPSGLSYASTGQCLTKAGPGFGHVAFLTSCDYANPAQFWTLYMRHSPDMYEIRNDRGDMSGLCLGVYRKSTAEGADILAEPCDAGNFSQIWRTDVYNGNARSYTAVHSNKCLGQIPGAGIWADQVTCSYNALWNRKVFYP
jgi:hypothetical protein